MTPIDASALTSATTALSGIADFIIKSTVALAPILLGVAGIIMLFGLLRSTFSMNR